MWDAAAAAAATSGQIAVVVEIAMLTAVVVGGVVMGGVVVRGVVVGAVKGLSLVLWQRRSGRGVGERRR